MEGLRSVPKGVYWSPIIYSHLQIKSRHYWRRSGDLQGGPDPLANGIIAGAARRIDWMHIPVRDHVDACLEEA